MATIKFGKKAKKVGDKAQVPGPSAPLASNLRRLRNISIDILRNASCNNV